MMKVKEMIERLSKLDPDAIMLHDLEDGQPPVRGAKPWYRSKGVVYPTESLAKEAGGKVEKVVLVT